MVYIGPINTLSLTAKTKTVSSYSPEQNLPVSKLVDTTTKTPVTQTQDRRRQRDRRKHPRAPMLETRQGERRASGRPKIDISV